MTPYEKGFFTKCAEHNVDPAYIAGFMKNRTGIQKSAGMFSKIQDEGEHEKRRRILKNVILGLIGAANGTALGAGASSEMAVSRGEIPTRTSLQNGALLGALLGGAVGAGGGELHSRARSYFGLDPVLPTLTALPKN